MLKLNDFQSIREETLKVSDNLLNFQFKVFSINEICT